MELGKRTLRSRTMEARKRTCRLIRVSNAAGTGTGTMKNVPGDIIGEILSWLPVKCVLRCKCVCKSWQRITQQRSFIEKHRSRGKIQAGYELKYKSNTNGVTYDFKSYCKGFVLELKQNSAEYRIRNPATKQVLQVPCNPVAPLGIQRSLLVFDSSTSKYKMISFHVDEENTILCVTMLNIGSDDQYEYRRWRIPDHYTFSISKPGYPITMYTFNDDLVYYVSFSSPELQKSHIIRFTVDGKSSMKIKVPRGFPGVQDIEFNNRIFQVFILDGGKLSLGFIIEQELHVWVLENYNKHIWSNKKIIPLNFINDYPKSFQIRVEKSSKGKMIVQIGNYLLQYDIHSRKHTCLAEVPPGKVVLYQHCPSLASLYGMRSEQLSL